MIVMVVAVILVVSSIGIYLNNGKTIQIDTENTKSSEVEDDNPTAIAEVTPENKVIDTTEQAMQTSQKLNQTGFSSNPGVNGQGMESGEPIKEPTGSDKFYLVLGCFYGRQMADSLCKKVKGDGFQALTSQSRKGFFFVSIGSYSTHQSASKALPAVKSVYSNVWIMKDI
jgi:cell division septation protein DedD